MANPLDFIRNMTPEQNQALLAAGSQILARSAPGRQPFSFGQAMGVGGLAFQDSMSEQQDRKQQTQMRGLQIKNMESDLKAQELARQRAQELQDLTKSYQLTRGLRQQGMAAPGDGATPSTGRSSSGYDTSYNGVPYSQSEADATMRSAKGMAGYEPEKLNQVMALARQGMSPDQASQMVFGGGGGPAQSAAGSSTQAPAPARAGNRNALVQERLQFAQYLRDNNRPAEAQAAEDAALKLQPKVSRWEEVQQNGRVMFAPFFEDGTSGDPVPLDVAKKLDAINRGGSTELVNPITGATVRSMENTVDPNTRANNAVSMRGQNMTDLRARELNEITRQGQQSQLINEPTQGPMLVDKGTGQARPVMLNGQPVQSETAAKKAASARNLMPLIGQAEKLIDGATGSYLGAGVDQAARWYGKATPGAQNIAQLSVLEGNIMMAQPRMEGPQSNMDVALYRQMAAQIGDPTVPNETKKAALTVLKSMYKKYAPDAEPDANAASGPKFLGFE